MATKRIQVSVFALVAVAAVVGITLALSGRNSDAATGAQATSNPETTLAAVNSQSQAGEPLDTSMPVSMSNNVSSVSLKDISIVRLEDELDPDEERVSWVTQTNAVLGKDRVLASFSPKVNPGTPEEDCWNYVKLTC